MSNIEAPLPSGDIRRIELLDRQQRLEGGVLYLGNFAQLCELYPRWAFDINAVLLLAEATAAQVDEIDRNRLPACTLLSRLSLASIFNSISLLKESEHPSVQEIWQQITSRQVVSASDIRSLLFNQDGGVYSYVQMLLVQTVPGLQISDQAVRLCTLLFPQDIQIPGKKEIIILRQYEKQLFSFPLPEGTEHWLRENHCILGVGNATRDYSMFWTIYDMIRRILRLGQKIREGEVIYRIDDYEMMLVIDYCIQEYIRRNGHHDICYLAHPILIHVSRYDALYGTNLREVLYQYLNSGNNLQKTAAALYMHRNTVLNKLKKISELVPLDFSDGLLCQRLLLSCQLLEYAEKILKQRVDRE